MAIVLEEGTTHEGADPPLAGDRAGLGVGGRIERFLLGAVDTGEQVRQHALAAGGDLLVMGAYTRPHFIEWLFGGPTQDILAHGTLPILTRHAPGLAG